MHRLQVRVEDQQHRFLTESAKRQGISIAELIRRLVGRQAEQDEPGGIDELMAVAGIGQDRCPLVNGLPVSEWPEFYLYAEGVPSDADG